VSHLHIPDGVLSPGLWLSGLGLAVALLLLATWWLRRAPRARLAYQGAIAALMLAAMAIELPLGPIDYHLSLVGPVGVLLGSAASFQVVFVVSAMLALIGHGGLTVVGWNAVVLGVGAGIARPVAAVVSRWSSPTVAVVVATAFAQAIAGGLWLAIMGFELARAPRARLFHREGGAVTVLAGLALPLWLLGIAVECVVAYGLARFLSRVRPDLLPARSRNDSVPSSAAPAAPGVPR
jgi:cobalt/nickel transport system permease protein